MDVTAIAWFEDFRKAFAALYESGNEEYPANMTVLAGRAALLRICFDACIRVPESLLGETEKVSPPTPKNILRHAYEAGIIIDSHEKWLKWREMYRYRTEAAYYINLSLTDEILEKVDSDFLDMFSEFEASAVERGASL